jgi:hypothetical protein
MAIRLDLALVAESQQVGPLLLTQPDFLGDVLFHGQGHDADERVIGGRGQPGGSHDARRQDQRERDKFAQERRLGSSVHRRTL